MSPRDIPAVKARLRAAERSALAELAGRALACASAQEVRTLESALAVAANGKELATA